jgi:hypothetical protein
MKMVQNSCFYYETISQYDSGASENEDGRHGSSGVDSDSRGQGNIRYATAANGSVLALQ